MRLWGLSLAASLAQCMDFVKVWWSIGSVYLEPFHFDDKGFALSFEYQVSLVSCIFLVGLDT